METITATGFGYLNVPAYVSNCPRCHHAIEARVSGPAIKTRKHTIQLCFVCPACLNFFLSSYQLDRQTNQTSWNAIFLKSEPMQHVPQSFGRVDGLSKQFLKIYNQASAAEASGLDEIAGVGYRKSLEFLVKDFCIAKHPEKEAEIKAKMLGSVIIEFIDDTRIKEAAKRTAWLGNDETHYERRWEGKDLQDLKNLLHLTINSIEGSLEYDFYMSEMDKPA